MYHIGISKPSVPLFPADGLSDIVLHTVIEIQHEIRVHIHHVVYIADLAVIKRVDEPEWIAFRGATGLSRIWQVVMWYSAEET